MFFGETPKNLDAQEKIRLNKLADELDLLQKANIKRFNRGMDVIPYVNYIVQDLRKGDLQTARANYDQQSDKFEELTEIKEFLLNNGIADKGIDWNVWHNSDSYEEYSDMVKKKK